MHIARSQYPTTVSVDVPQDLGSKEYHAVIPQEFVTGAGNSFAGGFLLYAYQNQSSSTVEGNAITIEVALLSEDGVPLGAADPLDAIFFIKNLYDSGDIIPGVINQVKNSQDAANIAGAFVAKNGFFINRPVYEALVAGLNASGYPSSSVLNIIGLLTDLSSGMPVLNENIPQSQKYQMDQWLNGMEIDPAAFITTLRSYYDRLFDFPISTKSISLQEVGGTFTITGADDMKLTPADFAMYDLSLEYSVLNEFGEAELVDIHYDWAAAGGTIEHNTMAFSFSKETLIVPAEADETLTVYVRGADGTELWSNEYRAGTSALRNIRIAVGMIGGGAVKPNERTVVNNKRLRGQILDMTGTGVNLKDAKILIEAKGAKDHSWQIVGSAVADKDGYFSLPAPVGIYTAARAVVSLMKESPAHIAIVPDAGDHRTISNDFLYLALNAIKPLPVTPANKEDDCDCHSNLKATRLPDHADLIHSDEYTQDLGAGCINLSTPNRTLKEYNHHAVVRTSDPDIANYTLTRDTSGHFTLTGERKKIRRRAIDLTNPVRWQDAPDTTGSIVNSPGDSGDNSHSNLSFYQAVTIATGHILHYKSSFKADGYSLGELIYSLPLAPGQKKQIVVFDASHSLQGQESQQLSVSERLAANITNDRDVVDQLSGSIGESLRGRSSAETGGVAAAAGAAGSGGAFGAAVGVAGGYAMAGSNASQDSARDISQFFAEKLRNNVMQNADSYRQQNASVISTVAEGQRYAATTEVVANHNHCHSLTMMYFEVLRHYAIYQELTNAEECVFVPLLMTNFTIDNIFKWRDVLAANLLPLPSNTYLPSVDGQHPLVKAFDAVHRRHGNYENIDYPDAGYDEEAIRAVTGRLSLRVNLPRPKTRFDRILSLPIISRTTYREEIDFEATAKAAACSFGLSLLFGPSTKTVAETVAVKAQVFDEFMNMAGNWESVPPAQSMSIRSFQPRMVKFDFITGGIPQGSDFFGNDKLDEDLWTAYASLLGFSNVHDFMDEYFKNKLIADWDYIFYRDIAPVLYEKLVKSLAFTGGAKDSGTNKIISTGPSKLVGSFTPIGQYTGGEVSMLINVRATTKVTRKDLGEKLALYSTNSYVQHLHSPAVLVLENMTLNYSTPHFNGLLFSGYIGDDLQDGAELDIVETLEDKRNPRHEDAYLSAKLIEHLNSNLEYYNKVLWYNLDADRRYMLLDGFNVQVFNDFGVPVGHKSLASVIKNELITVAGNSLVFPVSPGFRISRSYLVEKTTTGTTERVDLLEHYKPLTPSPPFRVSVPTKGLFVEAVKGMCDSCEKVEPNTSQDWNVFKADEPTAINAITAPTPVVTDWKATFKDIATAAVSMQTAPTAPNVGAGLQGLSDALTKADTFKDVTGLAANQANAASTYKANIEAASKMAEIAKGLATQEHNTDKSSQIMDRLKEAKASGAISQDDYNKLVKQHLQQQIDGGSAQNAEAKAAAAKANAGSPSLTQAAVSAVGASNRDVKATKTDADGNVESVEIKAAGTSSGNGPATGGDGEKVLAIAPPPGKVPLMKQKGINLCWATAATMMLAWKTKQNDLKVEDTMAKAGPEYLRKYQANESMKASEKGAFLKSLNMVNAPLQSLPPAEYIKLMNTYGPLWITMDAQEAEGAFAPHARILTKISGTGTSDGKGTTFYFNDPATGTEVRYAFLDFIKSFEQIVTDNKAQTLIQQVVYFSDKVSDTGEPDEGHALEGAYYWNDAVHENMTLAALMKSAVNLPETTLLMNADGQTLEFVRGAIWNDDPACYLFNDGFLHRMDNFSKSFDLKWGVSFLYGKAGGKPNRTNIIARSHFWDLQFLHAMASRLKEDPLETRAKILLWLEFAYSVSVGKGAHGTDKISDIPFRQTFNGQEIMLKHFFDANSAPKVSDTVNYLFARDSAYVDLSIERRTIGSVMHLIQDSFAKGHVKRRLINPEDLIPGSTDKFVAGKWGRYAEIETFHTYEGQPGAHAEYDSAMGTSPTPAKLDSFNGIIGARDGIRYSSVILNYWNNRIAYADGPKELFEQEIFKLSDKVTPADNAVN